MVDVLKRGTKEQIDCDKCGSTLRYSSTDIHLQHSPVKMGPYDFDDIEDHGHYRCVIKCPVCNTFNGVSVTPFAKRAAYERMRELENHFDHNL